MGKVDDVGNDVDVRSVLDFQDVLKVEFADGFVEINSFDCSYHDVIDLGDYLQ